MIDAPGSGRRVVHIIEPAHYGGAERVVRALSVGGRRRGDDIRGVLLLQHSARHPFAERLRTEGVPVTDIRCGRRAYLAESQMLAAIEIDKNSL